MRHQLRLDVDEELIVDMFAGGGGMSTAIEQALGRSPDIAINHDEDALSMHRVNHPQTRHFVADVFEVCPRGATQGRPLGLLHMSPECTHHSQAAGGQPRDKRSRSLSWVGVRWCGQVSPRILTMENVKQILQWGPLVAKRDKSTGRVVTLEKIQCPDTGRMVNRVADPGERVPVQNQYLVPDKKHAGRTWRRFIRILEEMGYESKWYRLPAANHGAATTRDRIFFIARRDGGEMVAPPITHHKKPGRGQRRWKPAADCIDWSIACPSIFERKRPLADATLRRIAKGIKRYVLDSADPFIVPIAHYNGREPVHDINDPLRTITANPKGGAFAACAPTIVPATHGGGDRNHDIQEPLPTITAAHRGELMLSSATLVGVGGRAGQTEPKSANEPAGTITSKGDTAIAAASLVQMGYGERTGQAPRALNIEAPLGTVVAGGRKHAVTTALLAQMNGGFNETPAHDARDPMSTITNKGSQQQLLTAHLAHLRGNCDARDPGEPLHTISAGGQHHAVVSATLMTNTTGHNGAPPHCPMPTLTTGQHQALVTAFMSRQFGGSIGHEMGEPLGTTTAGGGGKSAVVECHLSPAEEAGALRVAAFLMRYYSEGGQWGDVRDPMDTITTRDRLALVTVVIKGVPYVIVDIGLRMLTPRELYRAQGFPEDYIIDRGHDGRKFSKSKQVKMVGNSVSPPPGAAFIAANCADLAIRKPSFKISA